MPKIATYKFTIGKYFYYGSCRDYKQRKKKHRQYLRNGCHHNQKVQSAWNDIQDIQFELISQFDNIDLARALEQELLNEHHHHECCLNKMKKVRTDF